MSHTIGQPKQDNQQSNSNSTSSQGNQDSHQPENQTSKSNSTLTDADYEFLFNQLLEGISHGWHDRRIAKFFHQLGERGEQQKWVAWLVRLRAKLLTMPIPSKRQLGTLMIRLGELTQFTTEVNEIGAICNQIGRELLFGNTEDIVWEYVGSDLVLDSADKETKENLSEKLPTDFSQLGSAANDEEETNLSSEIIEERIAPNQELESHPTLTSESTSPDLILENLENTRKSDPEPEFTDINLSDSLEIPDLHPAEDSLLSPDDKTEQEPQDPIAIDMQQMMSLIQEDEELAQQISQKLNVSLTKLDNLAPDRVEKSPIMASNELDQPSVELIESWFNLGLKQVSAGEFDKAIASWEKALKINPNLSEAWHNRGSALGRLGKYEEAVKSFQRALAIEPLNYQAWNDRAHALYQMQQWSEAVNSWDNAIKITPGNHLFWYNRGCALEQLEDWEESITSYEKSLEIKPDFQPARSRYINLVADNSRSN